MSLSLWGDKVPCSWNTVQLHGDTQNPCSNTQRDSAHDRQDQAARAGGATGISIFIGIDQSRDQFWGCLWATLGNRGAVNNRTKIITILLPLVPYLSEQLVADALESSDVLAYTGHRALCKSCSVWSRMEAGRETFLTLEENRPIPQAWENKHLFF